MNLHNTDVNHTFRQKLRVSWKYDISQKRPWNCGTSVTEGEHFATDDLEIKPSKKGFNKILLSNKLGKTHLRAQVEHKTYLCLIKSHIDIVI